MHPEPQTHSARRDLTKSGLSWAAQLFIDALELSPPTARDPGYWRSEDGFWTVSIAVLRDGIKDLEAKIGALVVFHGADVEAVTKRRVSKEYPGDESVSFSLDERKQHCRRILQIGRQARTERVKAIVCDLEEAGISIPTETIKVHRISKSFQITLGLEPLRQIDQLRRQGSFPLRRITLS